MTARMSGRLLILALAFGIQTGCSGDAAGPDIPRVTAVALTADEPGPLVFFNPGDAVQLHLDIEREREVAGGLEVVWELSDPSVVAIDAKRLLHTIGFGSTSVRAVVNGISSGVLEVTVARTMKVFGAYNNACVITDLAGGFCWGQVFGPTPVSLGDVVDIAPGSTHVCILTTSGETRCRGGNGLVGHGEAASDVLVRIDGDPGLVDLSADLYHTCGVTSSSDVYCWGPGADGEGSTPHASKTLRPTRVETKLRLDRLGAGGSFTCALDLGGNAYCWGRDSHWGHLGTGNVYEHFLEPTPVATEERFESLHVAMNFVCGRVVGGGALCWGLGFDTAPVPVVREGLYEPLWIGDSKHHCGLHASGETHCWGLGSQGQLGDGGRASTDIPVAVVGGAVWAELAPGAGHTCGRTHVGGFYCWGSDNWRVLGTGTIYGSVLPAPVIRRP